MVVSLTELGCKGQRIFFAGEGLGLRGKEQYVAEFEFRFGHVEFQVLAFKKIIIAAFKCSSFNF